MFTHKKRRLRRLRTAWSALYQSVSKPLFWFCLLLAALPGALLASLLWWRAVMIPMATPAQLHGLFLPFWVLLSCGIPAFCAAAALSYPTGRCGRGITVTVPLCTGQLLLSYLWALTVLYRFPPLFCMAECIGCCILALLSAADGHRISPICGALLLIGGIWNACLVVLCAHF